MISSNTYRVEKISSTVGKAFIREHHYTHSCHNGPMTWGLFCDDVLIGVCAFATPSSENVRASVFGKGHENEVTELHRLYIHDGTPKNMETWFLKRAFQGLRKHRPQYRAVISFADSTEGHVGTVYQAMSAWYCGTTATRVRFWRDTEGRLRHPRQNGHNVTPSEAEALGWTPEYRQSKNRYLFFVGSPRQRKNARKRCYLKPAPYPKLENTQE